MVDNWIVLFDVMRFQKQLGQLQLRSNISSQYQYLIEILALLPL